MISTMPDKRMLLSLRVNNFLSYSEEAEEIPLGALNVLIGPNASGKSNLIEAIGLLRSTSRDLTAPIREGGGIVEWLWKGRESHPTAAIEATVKYPEGIMPLRYRLSFSMVGQRFQIMDEVVENKEASNQYDADVFFFYRYQNGHPVLNVRTTVEDPAGGSTGRVKRFLQREDLSPEQSVLSQRKDPDQYPEITYIGKEFGKIALYREWNLGRYTPPRLPQKADLPEDFLLEDASNLGLVLNDLQHKPKTKQLLLEMLRKFYDGAEDISTRIHGGTVQVFVLEKGLSQPVPATRLSDGTLRYLCLLTLLCHPTPPPLLCIEEPELGLHPDVLPIVADLLRAASERTQLVVTTHSETLVSALSDSPEAVVICERDLHGTHLRRLTKDKLEEWLTKYSLGELWRMGEIGGTRW
jgi:predicted ATPase